jgi:hypothetical protein
MWEAVFSVGSFARLYHENQRTSKRVLEVAVRKGIP